MKQEDESRLLPAWQCQTTHHDCNSEWNAIPHRPYSPDLALSDLLLTGFPKMHFSSTILWVTMS